MTYNNCLTCRLAILARSVVACNSRRWAYALTEANGLWRSLVAHLTGGQGVAGSNPVSPTN